MDEALGKKLATVYANGVLSGKWHFSIWAMTSREKSAAIFDLMGLDWVPVKKDGRSAPPPPVSKEFVTAKLRRYLPSDDWTMVHSDAACGTRWACYTLRRVYGFPMLHDSVSRSVQQWTRFHAHLAETDEDCGSVEAWERCPARRVSAGARFARDPELQQKNYTVLEEGKHYVKVICGTPTVEGAWTQGLRIATRFRHLTLDYCRAHGESIVAEVEWRYCTRDMDPVEALGEMVEDARQALAMGALPELPAWIEALLEAPVADNVPEDGENLIGKFSLA